MKTDMMIAGGVALCFHAACLLAPISVPSPTYSVVVSESALEVTLIQSSPKSAEEKKQDSLDVLSEKSPEPVGNDARESAEAFFETPNKIDEEENADRADDQYGAVVDASPLPQHYLPPHYPREAKKKGWEGRVILDVKIRMNGIPDTVRVSKSSGYEILDREAVLAVKKWRFHPAQLFGSPIDSRVKIPIVFKLEK